MDFKSFETKGKKVWFMMLNGYVYRTDIVHFMAIYQQAVQGFEQVVQ